MCETRSQNYIYRVKFGANERWLTIRPDTIISRSSTDGKSYETAEVQLLWERANELTQRELDEMEEKEQPPGEDDWPSSEAEIIKRNY